MSGDFLGGLETCRVPKNRRIRPLNAPRRAIHLSVAILRRKARASAPLITLSRMFAATEVPLGRSRPEPPEFEKRAEVGSSCASPMGEMTQNGQRIDSALEARPTIPLERIATRQ